MTLEPSAESQSVVRLAHAAGAAAHQSGCPGSPAEGWLRAGQRVLARAHDSSDAGPPVAVDNVLAAPEIDGIFVGLSNLSNSAENNPMGREALAALDHLLTGDRTARKLIDAYTPSGMRSGRALTWSPSEPTWLHAGRWPSHIRGGTERSNLMEGLRCCPVMSALRVRGATVFSRGTFFYKNGFSENFMLS